VYSLLIREGGKQFAKRIAEAVAVTVVTKKTHDFIDKREQQKGRTKA
jgi:hypothetical protein